MRAFLGVGFDQLAVLAAAVEEGSFSAAARRLGRTQPAVSETIAQLERQLGLKLFDRAGRYPRLTEDGRALMPEVRAALAAMQTLGSRARGLADGSQAEFAVAVDVFVPQHQLTAAAHAFHVRFGATPLRIFVEALGACAAPVLDGRAELAILGSLPTVPPDVAQERVGETPFIWVAAAGHPLADQPRLSREQTRRHRQIVLSDRISGCEDTTYGVLSPLTLTISDIGAKLALILEGVGWGGLPLHMVQEHLAEGRLVELAIDGWADERLILPLTAIYPRGHAPRVAARWFIDFIAGRHHEEGSS